MRHLAEVVFLQSWEFHSVANTLVLFAHLRHALIVTFLGTRKSCFMSPDQGATSLPEKQQANFEDQTIKYGEISRLGAYRAC